MFRKRSFVGLHLINVNKAILAIALTSETPTAAQVSAGPLVPVIVTVIQIAASCIDNLGLLARSFLARNLL